MNEEDFVVPTELLVNMRRLIIAIVAVVCLIAYVTAVCIVLSWS